LPGKNRVFNSDFKQRVAVRILNGESVTSLHHELGIRRSVLYRWRDAYRKEGRAAFQRSVGRPPGVLRPPKVAATTEGAAAHRIAELERKIGQQALDIDFLQRAFKRVKEARQNSSETGGAASTTRSEV
jgi:transposase-like protein